ncbi:MAG: hypothetical protein C4320_05360, partial [Armatimonadota bacterium]
TRPQKRGRALVDTFFEFTIAPLELKMDLPKFEEVLDSKEDFLRVSGFGEKARCPASNALALVSGVASAVKTSTG